MQVKSWWGLRVGLWDPLYSAFLCTGFIPENGCPDSQFHIHISWNLQEERSFLISSESENFIPEGSKQLCPHAFHWPKLGSLTLPEDTGSGSASPSLRPTFLNSNREYRLRLMSRRSTRTYTWESGVLLLFWSTWTTWQKGHYLKIWGCPEEKGRVTMNAE